MIYTPTWAARHPHVPGNDKTQWAREYVELPRQTKPAIEAVDPGARIVLGGLADASWRIIAQLHRAGVRGLFDVASVQIFTSRPGFVMAAARLMRRQLRRNGEGRKPIWVTDTTFRRAKEGQHAPRCGGSVAAGCGCSASTGSRGPPTIAGTSSSTTPVSCGTGTTRTILGRRLAPIEQAPAVTRAAPRRPRASATSGYGAP